MSYGIHVMVYTYVSLTVLWMFIWYGLSYRFIGYKPLDFMKDICPFFLTALAVMTITYLVTMSIENLVLLLLVRIVMAASLYYLVMKIARVKILDECVNFILRKKNN